MSGIFQGGIFQWRHEGPGSIEKWHDGIFLHTGPATEYLQNFESEIGGP